MLGTTVKRRSVAWTYLDHPNASCSGGVGIQHEIRKQLIALSDREIGDSTLSKKLSELTELGLLSRKSFDEVPPRVEYALSDAGLALFMKLNDLGGWAREECHSGGLRIPQARKPLQDPSPVESI